MAELAKAQQCLTHALGHLAPANPHPVTNAVRAQLPALRERLQALVTDVGLLREVQEHGAPISPDGG